MKTPALTQMLGTGPQWRRSFAVATAAGLFLGLTGPIGSFLAGSHVGVALYWITGLWLGAVIFGLVVRAALQMAPDAGWLRLGMFTAAMLVAAILTAAACRLLATAIWPGVAKRVGRLAWFVETLVIAAPLGMGYARFHGLIPGLAPAGTPRAPRPARPLAPPALTPFDGELLALQMEDHYVRIHTARGSTLLHVPMAVAVAALAGRPGLRVHRSWWVAKTAVANAVQDGRNLRLVLTNGLHAPVARSQVAAARHAGLLARHHDAGQPPRS